MMKILYILQKKCAPFVIKVIQSYNDYLTRTYRVVSLITRIQDHPPNRVAFWQGISPKRHNGIQKITRVHRHKCDN